MNEIKINYNELMKDIINNLSNRPKLLLHACCGPCATYPIDLLIKNFDLDVLYLNQNIFPYEEWKKRLETLKYFIEKYNAKNNLNIKLIVIDYDHDIYLKDCKNYFMEKEGGKRCELCHQQRLNLAYKYADENNYDYFTTVMTVSSHKPSSFLNEIGKTLSSIYKNTKYLYSDFKKEEGQLKGIKIAKEYNLYRQNYCGCEYSIRSLIK